MATGDHSFCAYAINRSFTWGLAADATVTHVATVAARPAGGRSAEIRPDDKAGERGFA